MQTLLLYGGTENLRERKRHPSKDVSGREKGRSFCTIVAQEKPPARAHPPAQHTRRSEGWTHARARVYVVLSRTKGTLLTLPTRETSERRLNAGERHNTDARRHTHDSKHKQKTISAARE